MDDFNKQRQLNNALHSLGNCPQSNALWEDITVQEHLKCYSLIKGVPMNEIKRLIERYIFRSFSCKFLQLRLKGTVMQNEKVSINDHLRVSKVS